MFRSRLLIPLAIAISAACGLAQTNATTSPAATPPTAQSIYDRITPSLVAVQFTLNYEFGRVEWVGPGVVVSDDGLVMIPGDIVNENFPDEQLKDFKIIVPGGDKDDEELPADFQGRDEPDNLSFVKVTIDKDHPARQWKSIKFIDAPLPVGKPLFAVGMLAKTAGYRTFLTSANVAAQVRGEIPQVLVSGALGNIGSPVFDEAGNAVGLVNSVLFDPYLSRTGGRQEINPMAPILNPPRLFTATKDFVAGIDHPPTPDHPLVIPWVGLPQLVGVSKDVAEAFGLANQPAIQIGTTIPDSPATAAGLQVRQIIVKMNGQPLTRGDEPEELPQILRRQIMRMHVGEKVTLSVLNKKGDPLQDLTVTLGERPARPNTVKRFYADDLGFGVRQVTFEDTFRRKKPANFPGVVVTIMKPSGAAMNAKLAFDDLITEINNTPVTTLDGFTHDYQSIRTDKPRDAIVLVVMKPDGMDQTIRIEPPQ